MKKFKTLLITSLTAILLCFCFLLTGCSAAGTYEFQSVEIGGVEYKVGDEIPMLGKLEADEFEAITLNKDGTIAGEDNEGMTWTQDGDTIIIKVEYEGVEEEVMKLTKDGNKLIMERNMGVTTMKIVYKK